MLDHMSADPADDSSLRPTQEQNSDSWWSRLPTVDDGVADTVTVRKLRTLEVAPKVVGRRRFVQGFVVLAGAVSLNIVGAFSNFLTRPAAALTGYKSCTIYDSFPGYAENPSELVCVGAPYSYRYCSDTGWFRSSSSTTERYVPNETLCNGANAWWWYHSNQNTTSPSGTYRCSDGDYFYLSGGTWVGGGRICSSIRSSSDITE